MNSQQDSQSPKSERENNVDFNKTEDTKLSMKIKGFPP